MRVSSLLKAVTWKRTGRDSNPRPFGSRENALRLSLNSHGSRYGILCYFMIVRLSYLCRVYSHGQDVTWTAVSHSAVKHEGKLTLIVICCSYDVAMLNFILYSTNKSYTRYQELLLQAQDQHLDFENWVWDQDSRKKTVWTIAIAVTLNFKF